MSDLKTQIHDAYKEAVALSSCPQELKNSLKTNERVPGFLKNLQKELATVPGGVKPYQVKMTVYDLTRIFLRAVERKANERMLSDAEKTRITKEQDKVKKFKEVADTGVVTEEFLEDV